MTIAKGHHFRGNWRTVRLTLNSVDNSLCSVSQRVQERSTHPDPFRTETEGFDNVCPSSNTSVDVDLYTVLAGHIDGG